MEEKKEKRIEKCSRCGKKFNIFEHDNSGYVGVSFKPVCKICREEFSI